MFKIKQILEIILLLNFSLIYGFGSGEEAEIQARRTAERNILEAKQAEEKRLIQEGSGLPPVLSDIVIDYATPSAEQVLAANQQLLKGAHERNIDMVKQAIENGADVNIKDSSGDSAIFIARYNIDIVKTLLDNGADINARGPGTFTELMIVSEVGLIDIVKLLLEKGANVNLASSISRDTALILAARKGHTRIVTALLSAGADINAKDEDNRDAYDWAILTKHYITAMVIKAWSAMQKVFYTKTSI